MDEQDESVAAINEAIAILHDKTCIKMVERTSERSFLVFKQMRGCYSAIGNQNSGSQVVSIGLGCATPEIVLHEIMHALGFVHEQSRIDRDDFLNVHRDRVKPGMTHIKKTTPVS